MGRMGDGLTSSTPLSNAATASTVSAVVVQCGSSGVSCGMVALGSRGGGVVGPADAVVAVGWCGAVAVDVCGRAVVWPCSAAPGGLICNAAATSLCDAVGELCWDEMAES